MCAPRCFFLIHFKGRLSTLISYRCHIMVMVKKSRAPSKPFLITEILNQMRVEYFMEKRYVLHEDQPRVPIKRTRVVGIVLEKRVGVSKTGVRYAILKVTDGTGVIKVSMFGMPEESSTVSEGNIVEIIGRIALNEYSTQGGKQIEEWTILVETISVKNREFLHYYSLQFFDYRAPLSKFLENLYVDKVYEIRHLRSCNYMSEKNQKIKAVISGLFRTVGNELTLEFILSNFNMASEDVMEAIYELKEEGKLIQPEFGRLVWTNYTLVNIQSGTAPSLSLK